MDRRRFLAASGVLLHELSKAGWSYDNPFRPRRKSPPNIILIIADDLGYGDLGCHGCADIPTPNIDSLAANGVRFTDGYATAPVCSPSRAGLMTGSYQQRFGHEFNPGPKRENQGNFGLPQTKPTIAEYLVRSGYATALIGKWHLGHQHNYRPTDRGFQSFFGFYGGSHAYFYSKNSNERPIWRNEKRIKEREYLTDAFSREAVHFIKSQKKNPFFLCLSYSAVHSPLEAPKDRLFRFSYIKDKKRRMFAAMLSAVDDGIGEILFNLRRLGIERDTLIFFFSDNGGPTIQTRSSNFPFRGFKDELYEGGIRVPLIAQWKSVLQQGKVFEDPVILLDIMPTVLSAAYLRPFNNLISEGVNLLPYMCDQIHDSPHETLFWRYGPCSAVRKGEWKLIGSENARYQLFNLVQDKEEKYNLALKYPQQVKELIKLYKKWNLNNIPSRWPNPKDKLI